MRYCREIGALYIDTVVEPWPGFYFDKSRRQRVAHQLRAARDGARRAARQSRRHDRRLLLRRQSGHGLVVRQAGAAQSRRRPRRQGRRADRRARTGAGWRSASASRASTSPSATRSAPRHPKPRNVFVNTWSVEGFLSEGMQPAELGWGTHEKWTPANAGFHEEGCGAAIYLEQPGANTRVRSWTPTAQAQFGFLVTHNESISIADYYTLRDEKGEAIYRPTCHYAYHPVRRRGAVPARNVRPRRRDAEGRTTSSARPRSSTASTSSACCSTATRATPIGTARSSRSRRRARSRPTRTPPACR